MKDLEIDKKALNKFLKEKINREIILQYLFLESIEKQYGDEYIKTMYRINPENIRKEYNSLDKEEILDMEKDIKAKIQAGQINLNTEAVRWHKESFEHKRKIENNEKEEAEECR